MFGRLTFYVFLILHIGITKAHDFLLTDNVKPIEYDLTIIPNLSKGTYTGRVVLTVTVTNATNYITMHSKNLEISETRVNWQEVAISANIAYDFITLRTLKSISKGTHTVTIAFKGDMKNKTYGFFRGYEDENGERRYFGATFFEPINARVAFPCFDEPKFKARFTLHVAKPPGYIALSNMNEINQTPGPNDSTFVHFAKTPVMSSYLVSFFVGNYTYVEDYYVKQNHEIVPTRIYSPPAKIENIRFSAHEIPKLLKWFSNYTGFDYMLPKLDYITFNSKFHIEGGMEDWGAISCREDSVFYNNNMSKLSMGNVLNIAHEFAHIWFGDLLTTSSWTEFWLNEGFARFMDNKANKIYEDWEKFTASSMSTLQSALWRDDELTAKPLSWEIENALDVYQLLNNINYDKGGSVLHMIEDLIGEELMKIVIQTYVKKYQYQNVVSRNFIDILQNFVTFNASDFVGSFVQQSGYPVINVNKSGNKREIELSMTRFLRFGQVDNETRWSLPMKYITNLNGNYQVVWFGRSQNRITMKFPSEVTWIKLNFQRGGYYRVNYPTEMWMHFSTIMKNFSIQDRTNLLDDSVALVRSGQLECSVAFNIMNYLSDEERFEVWTTAQHNFQIIRLGLLQHNFSISHLLMYIRTLIDKQYKRNNWTVDNYESMSIKRTRLTIFNLACFYGHKECQRKIKKLWAIKNSLPIDIKNIVLTNNPNRAINYNTSSHATMEAQSNNWFGADLSQLPVEPLFIWPKKIMNSCNEWLKKRFQVSFDNVSRLTKFL